MTERFYSPVIKYTTSTLKTLPGALLYFYETGTSTPKTTWKDPERTIPHAHPVVALHADGTFAPIFINGIYRVELKNAAGVTQPGWPVDDVGSPAAGFPFQSWSSTYSYSEDDLVTYNGEFYQSLDDDNVGNIPSSSPAFWQKKVFLDAPTAESYLNGNADGTYTWRTIAQTKTDLSLPTDTVAELASRVQFVDTIADLAALTAANEDGVYYVIENDRSYTYDPGSAETADGWFYVDLDSFPGQCVQINMTGREVSIAKFGAVPGTDIADAIDAALAALTGTNDILVFPNTEYYITRTVYLTGLTVKSEGCKIYKDFDGVGIEVGGGADYFDFMGILHFYGINDGYYDPTLGFAPANTSAHGFYFNSGRLRIRGIIDIRNHQGDGARYHCAGNMNKSSMLDVWTFYCGRGHWFSGTQDDFSVCRMAIYSQFTWKEGIGFADDFMGRQFEAFMYVESGAYDGTSNGMTIGKLRTSRLFIYSENQTTSGVDIEVKVNCDLLEIEEGRGGSVTNSSTTTQFTIGGQAYPRGNNPIVATKRFPVTVSTTRTYTERVLGASLATLIDHMYRADGRYQVQAVNIGTTTLWNRCGPAYDAWVQETFGQKAVMTHYSALGTLSSPLKMTAGSIVYEDNAYLQTNDGTSPAYTNAYKMRVVADTVGGGNKASCSAIISLSSTTSAAVDCVKLLATGEVEILKVGVGIIAASPDGTRYRLTPPNGGGAATWVAA